MDSPDSTSPSLASVGSSCTPRADIKNILVTGGAGFIASWVARHLALHYAECYRVVVFDKLSYAASLNNISSLFNENRLDFVQGDICKSEDIASCMDRFQIDTVLHFAAESHVSKSFVDPCTFVHTNVVGTQVLLDEYVKRRTRMCRFFFCSTDEVYGEPDDLRCAVRSKETSSLSPKNPYAGTKAAAEMLVRASAASFGLDVLIMRSNNAYGPNQYPEKIVSRFSSLLSHDQPVTLHSSAAKHSRSYIYAADLATATDTILHRGEPGGVYNVTSSDQATNLEIAKSLIRLRCSIEPNMEKSNSSRSIALRQGNEARQTSLDEENIWSSWIHTVPTDRLRDDMTYLTDGQKLRELGWKQSIGLEEGLARTLNWFQSFGSQWWEK